MDVAPVFPLPNAVLFPDTVLPLHVFEQRYRDMVRDAIDGDGRIAIALLRAGWEDEYEGSPDIHEVGTVGRIEELRAEDDGRFYFNLVGEQRVLFEEIPSDRSYRLVRVIPRMESTIDDNDPKVVRAKLDLLATHGYLQQEISGGRTSSIVTDDRMPFVTAVNGACANLPVDPVVRQELLELDDLHERLRRAQKLINRMLHQVLELKGDGGGDRPECSLTLN